MGGRRRSAPVRTFGALLAWCWWRGAGRMPPGGARVAKRSPCSISLSRPRILGAGADVNVVTARLNREPYRTIFLRLDGIAKTWNGVALDDHSIASERIKAKAAKDLAFEYAINRTEVGGAPAAFPTPAARQAVGDRARDLLLNMYTRSRLAVPAPLGGSDRDINTSEELLQYSTAYDTLLGATTLRRRRGHDPHPHHRPRG